MLRGHLRLGKQILLIEIVGQEPRAIGLPLLGLQPDYKAGLWESSIGRVFPTGS